MTDIVQLKEDGVGIYLKTHADAIDGIDGKLVKASGNETILGTKNFQDGIQIKGNSLDDRHLGSQIYRKLGTDLSEISTGSMELLRVGIGVMFTCSMQLAKEWPKDTRFTTLPVEFRPALIARINSTEGKMIYISDDGMVKTNADLEIGDWVTCSGFWIAKNA